MSVDGTNSLTQILKLHVQQRGKTFLTLVSESKIIIFKVHQ